MENDFVFETSNKEKLVSLIKLIIFIIFFTIFGFILTIFWDSISLKLPFVSAILNYFRNSITELTLIGIFYVNFLGGIFFVPSPDEILYYYAISKNGLIFYTTIFSLAGFFLSQVLNYLLGFKVSNYVLNFVSKRKLYQSRRFINKYGGAGIFIFNFFPFPAPLLTLGLGIAKYNFKRLMLWAMLGKTLKFIVIILFYLIFRSI